MSLLTVRFPILFFLFCQYSFLSFSAENLVSSSDLLKDATRIVAGLGLNCVRADEFHKNIAYFVSEANRIIEGIGVISSESMLQMALKHDFPTACSVLTSKQLNHYYKEQDRVEYDEKCVSKVAGRCVLRKKVKKVRVE